jgi:hygromycin-B 7''-O-kinase
MSRLPEDVEPGTRMRALLSAEQWRTLLSSIFARHGLSAAGLTPEVSGSDVVWGTATAVLKMTAPRWRQERDAEAFAAEFLSGKLPFETPPLIALGEAEGWPYVITGRIGGVAVGRVWGSLSHAARRKLAWRIGAATASLHAVPPPAGPDGWEDFLATWCMDDERHRSGPPHLVAQLADFRSIPPTPREPRAWLHTELLDEHILVAPDGDGWRVSGMLDFADGRVGEVGYELTAPADFIFKGEPGIFPVFLAGYGLPDADPEGLLRWYLTHRFGRLARLVAHVGDAGSLSALARRAFG